VPDHSTLSRRAATLEVPRPTRPSSAGLDGESEPMHLLVDRAWFRKCHSQVTTEIDRALMIEGFLVLGVTLI
jgi:hypothetical protein